MNFLKKIPQFFIDKRPRLTLFLMMFLFLCYFYSPVLFHPSSCLFGDTGDAIKNYYCYEWHVQNDSSFVNYSGTNYPFGEQHAYTDGNPLLSNTLKVLPFLKDHSIAIFNLSMLFSIIFTTLLIFSILKEFKVANVFSILGAVGISILSPQTERIHGHFTLSYSFFIPLVIYLLLLFETRERKMKYTIWMAVVLLCSFFVHPYMGMILTSLVFMYHFIKLIFHVSQIKRIALPFVVQAVFPICFYFLYLKMTDTHINRTSHPYGFLFFSANIESVFVSSLPPFRHMISQLIKIRVQHWEGMAYVGVTGLFTALYLPVLLFIKRHKLKNFLSSNREFAVLSIVMISSFFLLLFAMGYPFKWGAEWILDKIPVIKQFRAHGRFAWVFYFALTITSVVVLSKYFLAKVNVYFRKILIALMLILFTVEGIPFHQSNVAMGITKNCFDKSSLDVEMKQICDAIVKENPQAIIPLPFFHFGTDYFAFGGTDKIKSGCFISSFHTKIPILGNCTDRTSLDEAKMSVQIIGSSLITKDLGKFIKSNQSFCVLFSKETLEDGEDELLRKGKTIIETRNYLLKKIGVEELFAKKYFLKDRSQLVYTNGYYITDSSYVKGITFDNLPDKQASGAVNKGCLLLNVPRNSLEKEGIYEISFWYDLLNGDELESEVVAEEILMNGDSVRILNRKKCSRMPNVVGDKVLVSLNFQAYNPENPIRIVLKENKDGKGNFTLDNILVRRKDVDVYKRVYSPLLKDSVLTLNNFVLQ